MFARKMKNDFDGNRMTDYIFSLGDSYFKHWSKEVLSIHSKIHVADFTFMVRRINENRHTLSAYVFLR
jgi:hypothetical protein